MAIDITALNAEFKLYYKQHRQNMNSLRSKIIEATDTEAWFDDVREIIDDVEEVGFYELSVSAQRWQANFTKNDLLKLEVEKAQVTKLKLDLEFVPDELESTWYGFLITKKLDPKDYPFTAWYIDLALPAYKLSWEENEVYKGIQQPIVANTATISGQSINGLEKIIKDGITAGKITPNALGVPPTYSAANADIDYVNYVEQYIYDIPEKIRKKMKPEILCDTNRLDLYRSGRRRKYSAMQNLIGIDASIGAILNIGDTGFKLKGVDSMDGKNRLVGTRKGNAYNINRRPDPNTFRILPTMYEEVRITTKWSKTNGFWHLPWVETTNVD